MEKTLAIVLATVLLAITSAAASSDWWNDASAADARLADGTGFAQWAADWEEGAADASQVVLTPGATESEMQFCWYSRNYSSSRVRVSRSPDMSEALVYEGESRPAVMLDGVRRHSNRVTVEDLEPGNTYYYQVQLDGEWQPVECFATGGPDRDTLVFLFVGDPQIGASRGNIPAGGGAALNGTDAVRNDAFHWTLTLDAALERCPQAAFLLCAGDQINESAGDGGEEALAQQEREYAGFLSPRALRSLPVAAVMGNHDAHTAAYHSHFHNPNQMGEEGYFFVRGEALFVVLNTNLDDCGLHRELLERAVEAHPDAVWRIVAMHQDLYGAGVDHSRSDGMLLRTQLTPLFDEFAVDLVLQGHDHSYARSHHLTGDGKVHGSYGWDAEYDQLFQVDNRCYEVATPAQGEAVDPLGTLYLTANTSTGSKYHEIVEELPDYLAVASQTWSPSYTVVELDAGSLTLETWTVKGELVDRHVIRKTVDAAARFQSQSRATAVPALLRR